MEYLLLAIALTAVLCGAHFTRQLLEQRREMRAYFARFNRRF